MRNLKKAIAFIIALTIMAVAVLPSLAAETYQFEAKAKILSNLGLVDGANADGDVEFQLGASLDRQTAVALIVKLFGKKQAALSLQDTEVNSALSVFSKDKNTISTWAKKYVAYGVINKMTNGTSATTFSPKASLDGKTLATLILRQLGYEVSPTTGWQQAATTLAEKAGMDSLAAFKDTKLNQDKMYGVAYYSLFVEGEDGKTLAKMLVDDGIVTVDKLKTELADDFTKAKVLDIKEVTGTVTDVSIKIGEAVTGLPEKIAVKFSDDSTGEAAVTWDTSAVDKTKAGSYKVTGTVEGYATPIEANVIVKAATLEVESVTALNLKQIKVVFNKEVEETSAETASNYEIYDNGSTTVLGGTVTAVLQSDKKSVLLLLDNNNPINSNKLTNLSNAKVVVKTGVKGEDGVALAANYTNTTVAVSDVSRPVVEKVEQTAPDKLKVYFNEAVYDLSQNSATVVDGNNFKLDNGSYILANTAVLDLETNTVTLTILGTLANGDHTLTVNPVAGSDLQDMAGFEADQASNTTFTSAGDAVAPTVTVKSATQSSVTFKFSEAIKNATNANVAYRHSLNSTQYQVLGSSGNVTVSTDNTEVTVDFKTPNIPLPAGNANIFITYISDTGTKIQDNFNNNLEAVSMTTEVVADSTKPTVTAALVTDSNTAIDITASEAVTGGTTPSNYTLKDSSNNAVSFTVTQPDVTKNVFRLTTTTAMSGNYTLTVAGLKDKAIVENTMDTYTTTIAVPDKIVPSIADEANVADATPNFFVQGDNKTCRIYFTEAMNTTDLATLAKYQHLVGSTYKNPTSATPAADAKSVYLVFEDTIAASMTMAQMSDVAGNAMGAMSTSLTAAGASTIGLDSSVTNNVVATSLTTIKMYLGDLLNSVDALDLEVDPGTGVWGNGTVTTDNSSGKSVLTITLPAEMSSVNISNGLVQVRTVSAPNTAGTAANTKNIYGVALNVAAKVAVDQAVPTLATTTASNSMETMDVDADGKIDHIKVIFAEDIAAGSVSADKFTVTGYTVKDAYTSTTAPTSAADRTGATVANSTAVYIRVDELTSVDSGATPYVTIGTGITDKAGNAYAGLAATVSVDKAAPVLLTANGTDGSPNVVLTWSEDVSGSNTAFANLAVANLTFVGTTNTMASVTAMGSYGSSTTVVMTNNVVTADIGVDTMAAATVYDKAGNAAAVTAVPLS